ncbi:PadR family transcriptional regulator [Salinibacterium soli]|uniref:PadR family transcriptional regulator n=1 Tax=Antiquaquibacter soli TaxID=3064523 RepID=A0ABT9BR85_9MICO|nr:PadR family transcriptional regulator [Protaetiibacter sp. WY-16]MDO7882953.1 PadR family transcriptional regulator [Protaetiibacter sp. WY-16]
MAADRRSPLAFVVLATLAERPLHVYALFRVLQERGKTEIVAVPTRASLYPVLERLGRAGFVEVHATERDSRRPERTVYRVTAAGEAEARAALLHYLASSERIGFTAALSFAMLATPSEVADALAARRALLESERAALLDGLAAGQEIGLPDLFQLDERYRVALLDADLDQVDGLLARVRSGELTWSREWIEQIAAELEGAAE